MTDREAPGGIARAETLPFTMGTSDSLMPPIVVSACRTAGVLIAVVVLFSGASVFILDRQIVPLTPSMWCYALFALLLPTVSTEAFWRALLGSWLVRWAVGYAVLTCLVFAWTPPTPVALSFLRLNLLSALLLVALATLFCTPAAIRFAQRAIAVTLIVGVCLNVYDLAFPGTFSPIVLRAAGLYGNPNRAALALVFGMIVSVECVRPSLRSWLVLAVGFGVLLTLSRSGALLWGLALAVMVVSRKVRIRSLLLGLAVALGGIVVTLAALDRLTLIVSTIRSNAAVVSRIIDVSDALAGGDFSVGARVAAVEAGWAMFGQHPFLGAGLGAAAETTLYHVSPHNMYVYMAAEYGVLGFLAYPALILALVLPLWKRQPSVACQTGLFLALAGLISHNILNDWPSVVCIGLAAALAYTAHGGGTPATRKAPE